MSGGSAATGADSDTSAKRDGQSLGGRDELDARAVGELTREETRTEADSLYHKNLLPVTYVTGDLAGAAESPVYAILRMNELLSKVALPEGYSFEIYNTRQPFDTTKYAMKWDGEWHITYEVFRDLGLAFAAVLVLIYILVVSNG